MTGGTEITATVKTTAFDGREYALPEEGVEARVVCLFMLLFLMQHLVSNAQ